jgi:hypothetical protein
MKKTIFIVHDPGGYDVIFPVFNRFQNAGLNIDFYCLGPAAKIQPQFKLTESELLSELDRLIANDQLQMIVAGTSWGSETEIKAIQLCKSAGIVTVSILDYWSNYATRFRDLMGEFTFPDIYIVMDELARQEAIAEGVPPQIIKVMGHPGLDAYLQMDARKKLGSSHVRRILFLSQPISLFYGERLGYSEHSVLRDCLEVLDKLENTSLSVKFHPKDDPVFQEQYRDLSVEGSLSDLFANFDLIIGMSTMGILYAVLAGIPAISYQPQLIEQDFCIASKQGLIPLVCKKELLAQSVEYALSGNMTEIYKDKLGSGSQAWGDGKSTEKIFCFLVGVVK